MLVRFRKLHDHAQRAAARNDRRLVDRIGRRHVQTDDGVAAFMIGGQALLLVGHDHGAPLGAHHDLVLGRLEFRHGNDAPALARGQQRRLVHQIGEIGAGEARRATGDDPQDRPW